MKYQSSIFVGLLKRSKTVQNAQLSMSGHYNSVPRALQPTPIAPSGSSDYPTQLYQVSVYMFFICVWGTLKSKGGRGASLDRPSDFLVKVVRSTSSDWTGNGLIGPILALYSHSRRDIGNRSKYRSDSQPFTSLSFQQKFGISGDWTRDLLIGISGLAHYTAV